jgi:two-component system response regulator
MKILPEVLLAEDSDEDAELTIGALSEYRCAYSVSRVNDGAAALDYLFRRGSFAARASANPILLMLDVKMPKVSGLEVLRQIKNSPNLARIPVVVISSSYEEVDLKEASNLEASAYVVKPVRFQDFVDAVRTIGNFWGMLNILPSEQHKYHAN